MNIENLVFTEAETIDVFTLGGDYYFTLDAIDNFQLQQEQEVQEVLGRKGRKVKNLKKDKKVTFSGDNSVVSTGLIGAQTGSAFESGSATIMWTETIKTVSENSTISASTTYAPVSGNIISIHEKNADGTLGKKYEFDSTEGSSVAADHYKCTADGTSHIITFSFASGVAADKEFVVRYKRTVEEAYKHSNSSKEFSEECQVYVNLLAEDDCGNIYRVQIYFPKADFSGDVTLEVGNGQTVHSFSAESLALGCGSNNRFWDMIVFGSAA